ncbi:hypothetical protein GCM10027404_26070 [Arthrobacter tumbae]|uniref:hypothetical protein n=1 Tax=Arthrobacter tumbae TaxID=163874 RepID=UPI001958DD91|nr:hypothetical protein [Arthrobacter tumbae]MBM7781630.1 putative cupredoxin-like copper-binding protein [Arthrobacter tumbae]
MRQLLNVIGALLCCAVLAGCAATSGTGGELQEPSSELSVGLTEWSIETGPVQAVEGTVVITVTNAGATRHDLIVIGEGGKWATPVLPPGGEHQLSVSARAGEELKLICTLTGHHDQGMSTTIPVRESVQTSRNNS